MKSFLPFATQFVEMRQVVCRLPGAVFRGEREAVVRLFRIAVDQAQDAEVVQCAGIPGAAAQALPGRLYVAAAQGQCRHVVAGVRIVGVKLQRGCADIGSFG